MATKKVLKITPILIALNILVLLVIIGFYTFRLIKYYLIENGNKYDENTFLVDVIKKKQSFLDDTKGLVLNEETGVFTYKGDVDDNYVSYSGLLYRILNIDKNGNIKLVSENNVTILYPNIKDGYEKSSINKWLNVSDEQYSGVFENTLVNADSLITNTSLCNDVIDDLSDITCDEVLDSYKISLLSLYDYKMSGGKDGFLNNGDIFFLATLNGDNAQYYVTDEGEIAINEKETKVITVKPVITLSSTDFYKSGKGTKENPYIIEKHDVNTLADVYVNNIIKINDANYKVVEIQDDKVKLASVEAIKKDGEDYKTIFGKSDSAYTTKTTVGKYLNNTFLNSLDVKNYVVNSNYYTGTLSLTNYDYTVARSSFVKAKVGMLTIGDMFLQETPNTFTLLRGMEAPDIINVINESSNIFADYISAKYSVRPAFYLKDDLEIVSGEGTMDDPYELGVEDDKTEC